MRLILSALFNTLKIVQMKFIKKTLINKTLGVSVVVFVNSSCKADGG
jgi:hypothetical protein